MRQQQQLQLQNRRFDAALNSMSQGLAMFDGSGRLAVCNERYRIIRGLSPEEATPGRPLRDIIAHSHDRFGYPRDVDGYVAKVAGYGPKAYVEATVIRAVGQDEWRMLDAARRHRG